MAHLTPSKALVTICMLSIHLGVVQPKDITSLLSCPSDQFACADGSRCIPNSYLCDGDHDCEDASDESHSHCLPPCSSDMFACEDGSKCIPKTNLCNGYNTCDDNSNIFPSHCDNCAADHLFRSLWNGVDVCLNIEFKCNGSSNQFECLDKLYCVPKSYLCDDYDHCQDGSDENAVQCFQCADGTKSVKRSYLCDDDDDCDDASDESESLCLPPCSSDTFACADGSKCIPGGL